MEAKIYQVNVREELCRAFFVKAKSRTEAEEFVRRGYEAQEDAFMLDAENYVDDSGEVSCVDERETKDFKDDWIDYDLTKTENA